MGTDGASKAVVLWAVGGNFSVTVAKFVGWCVTRSPSLLAESLHSAADTANQALLLVGIRHSSLGPTEAYPWGRASARYLWNLISAMGIFFVGFGVTTYHGVASLIHPHAPDTENAVLVFGILVFSFVVECYVLLKAYRGVREIQGNRGLWEFITTGDDPTAVAVLLEDSIAVLGVLLAAAGYFISIRTGSGIPDAVASTVIGGLLGVMALVLAYANSRLLLGAAATPDEVNAIRSFLERQSSVEKVFVLKTRIVGPGRIRIAAEVEFHGAAMIDRDQMERDAATVRGNPSKLPSVLADTAERMVRIVGKEINRIERDLCSEFPSVVAVELEVN